MDCRHLEELYELFLLGALSEQTALELLNHLRRGCPGCLTGIQEAAETVYLLDLAAQPARPHPRVKAALLRQISSEAIPNR